MVRFLGIVFIALIFTGILGFAGYHSNGIFLYTFAQDQSMGIIGTILALNIATITFLLGHLYSIEHNANEELFKSTKSEVKQNVYFMAGMFMANLLVLALTPVYNTKMGKLQPAFIMSLISVFLLILVVIALIEIVQAIFSVSKSLIK